MELTLSLKEKDIKQIQRKSNSWGGGVMEKNRDRERGWEILHKGVGDYHLYRVLMMT